MFNGLVINMYDFELKTDRADRSASAKRRDLLRAANKCICGPMVGDVGRGGVVHGPPEKGGRCKRCGETRKNPRTPVDGYLSGTAGTETST